MADRFGCALWVVLTLPARAETWSFYILITQRQRW
jgi:hypothetical protein